ncbi:nucleoside hydrolase-like domain-containing protein [Vibrio mangrovi]|uniref:DUF1593 domain-containing protein n=1 Tax=Vibrio mangrovi TaxID=474394 RepID=A0A1Y6ITY9_9VIBR|nr:nucleoside hydrolase-like domain-containing protein [Vibrio mangrovi]MDW6004856.1 DUF1593 domain-containing protein [Vibrio mangrovi]SMS01147.1 hypothetical protein VIM7927_02424 [Vibrio mangrovi]
MSDNIKFNKKSLSLYLGIGLFAASFSTTAALSPQHIDDYQGHPRVFVFTDMGNEPDDQMSMVRLLTYSNELDIEGLIATTSTWQKSKRETETIKGIIESYGEVQPNLAKHASNWPSAEYLESLVSVGQPNYGMADVGKGKSSPGSKALIAAVDKNDERPLWVTVWGGANTLAQALYDVRATRSAEELKKFEEKIRVYSISDQDDAGPWIRKEFPDVFYIVKPSSPNGDEYASATWTGIAGDKYYKNGDGADFTTVTNEWLDKNIRSKGPLGKHYLKYAFIMEGDTPAYLGLTNNGLNSFRSPSWGGWGGRYVYRQPYGETHKIWSQGGDWFPRVNSADTVIGVDGDEHVSDHATIWRWRTQFQNDFAARMDWTIKTYTDANHHPELIVNGKGGKDVIYIDGKPGQEITLDASASTDPDKNQLSYNWFHYKEAGFTGELTKPGLADIAVLNGDKAKAIIKINKDCRDMWVPEWTPKCENGGTAHVILAVTDNGTPALTSYRRVIINVKN